MTIAKNVLPIPKMVLILAKTVNTVKIHCHNTGTLLGIHYTKLTSVYVLKMYSVMTKIQDYVSKEECGQMTQLQLSEILSYSMVITL